MYQYFPFKINFKKHMSKRGVKMQTLHFLTFLPKFSKFRLVHLTRSSEKFEKNRAEFEIPTVLFSKNIYKK